jgi:hypothetical protein
MYYFIMLELKLLEKGDAHYASIKNETKRNKDKSFDELLHHMINLIYKFCCFLTTVKCGHKLGSPSLPHGLTLSTHMFLGKYVTM